MRIGELAGKAGVSTSLLRYYEEQGLLQPARTESGYRQYPPEAFGRLGFIKRAKTLGLSLDEIRQLLRDPVPAEQALARLRHVIAHKLVDTQRRIAELETLRTELETLHVRLGRSGPPCGHLGECACWLPTQEEVTQMTIEVREAACCDCCDESACTCCEDGCDCCQ
ncbi:MAG: MerR family transcriptional regulator [Dehalococcoidia bacterium]